MADGIRTLAQRLGDAAEDEVARSLVACGWRILARNVHVGRGELDLIAIDPSRPTALVFVEVRWRAGRGFGLAEETVDHAKRRRLHRAAWRWLEESPDPPNLPVRFDLVVVEPTRDPDGPPAIRHHRSAF
jgi:putative endonuclease